MTQFVANFERAIKLALPEHLTRTLILPIAGQFTLLPAP